MRRVAKCNYNCNCSLKRDCTFASPFRANLVHLLGQERDIQHCKLPGARAGLDKIRKQRTVAKQYANRNKTKRDEKGGTKQTTKKKKTKLQESKRRKLLLSPTPFTRLPLNYRQTSSWLKVSDRSELLPHSRILRFKVAREVKFARYPKCDSFNSDFLIIRIKATLLMFITDV